MDLGNTITQLRKASNFSRDNLATTVGNSGAIFGRYERGEISPSVEVAAKIADALEVSLDYLTGNSKKFAIYKQTMKLIHEIEDLEPAIKDKLFFLANAIIRDAKTTKAYVH